MSSVETLGHCVEVVLEQAGVHVESHQQRWDREDVRQDESFIDADAGTPTFLEVGHRRAVPVQPRPRAIPCQHLLAPPERLCGPHGPDGPSFVQGPESPWLRASSAFTSRKGSRHAEGTVQQRHAKRITDLIDDAHRGGLAAGVVEGRVSLRASTLVSYRGHIDRHLIPQLAT